MNFVSKNILRLIIGFAAVISLMVVLIVISLNQMAGLTQQLDRVVKNRVVKMELANQMNTALREKAISLYFVATTKDSLLRGKEFTRISKYTLGFNVAHQQLARLETSASTKELIANIKEIVEGVEVHIDLASDFVFMGAVDEAHRIIRNEVLPSYREIRKHIDHFISLQHQENEQAIISTENSYQEARNQLYTIGISGLVISLLIAVYVCVIMIQQTRKLTYLAMHDNLTGLPTRSLFDKQLQHSIAKAKRGVHTFSVVVLDLDSFKQANDTFGHKAGDDVLVEVGKRLTTTLREYDVVSRVGGDEFFLLISDVDLDATMKILKRIDAVLTEPIECESYTVKVGASLGAAHYPEHGKDAEALMKYADKAMYSDKRKHS